MEYELNWQLNCSPYCSPGHKLASQVLLLVLLAIPCQALEVQAETMWQVAPGRSTIDFKVAHLLFLKVGGRFREFEGTVQTRQADLTQATIRVTIQAASIYTGNQDRDEHLLAEEFFHASRFPQITFESQEIARSAEGDTYKIAGNLTIRGITKPIDLVARLEGRKTLPDGTDCIHFTASGLLNRFDYGLKWNELAETGGALVGELVEIGLKVVLRRVEPIAPTLDETEQSR